MRIRSAQSVRPKRLRRALTAMAMAVGVSAGMMAAPAPAFAGPPISGSPPGGWCYQNWYTVQSVGSVVHNPVISTRSFQNSSSSTTVTWHESYTATKTYNSGYSTSGYFGNGGVNQAVITQAVNRAQPITTSTTLTVNTTSSFSAPVPPLTTAYATYGTYGLETSGVYNQTQYACDDGSYYSIEKAPLTAYSLTSVGWHYWDSNGSSSNL